MNIRIREADVLRERVDIVSFLKTYLNPDSSHDRYNWLYRDNPFGQAKVWVAYEVTSSRILGISSAFPRMISIKGNDHLCWVLGDFCIHPSCRSLGPALLLQKASLKVLGGQQHSCTFDFPSVRMMAIYKRLGIESYGSHVRFIKPLRMDKKVGGVVPFKGLAAGLASVGNAALQFRDLDFRASQENVARYEGEYGDEFYSLFRRGRSEDTICTVRTTAYLNWRYHDNPLYRYEIWTYREQDELCGYCVVLPKGDVVGIVEIFGDGDEKILERLILAVAQHYRQQQYQSLEFCFLGSHPFAQRLKKIGFFEREGNVVVLCGEPKWISEVLASHKQGWWLTSGDRES